MEIKIDAEKLSREQLIGLVGILSGKQQEEIDEKQSVPVAVKSDTGRYKKRVAKRKITDEIRSWIVTNSSNFKTLRKMSARIKKEFGTKINIWTISDELKKAGLSRRKTLKLGKAKTAELNAYIMRRFNEGTLAELSAWIKQDLNLDIPIWKLSKIKISLSLKKSSRKRGKFSQEAVQRMVDKYKMVSSKKCYGKSCENIVRRKPEWTDKQWAYIKMCSDCFSRVMGRAKSSGGFKSSASFNWIQVFGESGLIIKNIISDCLQRKQKIQPEDFLSLMSKREFINDLSVKILAEWKGILKDLGLEGKTFAMSEEIIYLR